MLRVVWYLLCVGCGVRCLMFVACCVLLAVCCWFVCRVMRVVCCLLLVACCLCVVRCVLCDVWCALCVPGSLLGCLFVACFFVMWWLLFVVCGVLLVV